jgi:[ribosomal protein S18]-alanine N-acetyltransferase
VPDDRWAIAFRPLTERDAAAVAAWRYEGPYAFYNLDQDPADWAEFLDPANWPNAYYAAIDARGALVGFFSFRQIQRASDADDGTLEIGLGLRPDLTGKGLGLDFVRAGLAFAGERFAPARFRLAVATFNRRAIRVYERAGFRPVRTFANPTNGGVYEFLEMARPVDGPARCRSQPGGAS